MREFDVTTDDGRVLHGYDTGPTGGSDELVVFWYHGTPDTGAPPKPVVEAAGGGPGIRWIGYDRPGYGGSTPDHHATVASAADDARQVADLLGIGRFAVVGHSGGGPCALACGALLADRVLAVVSISSLAPWPDGRVQDDVTAMAAWGFDLREVTIPTLIMHGTANRMVPSRNAEWLAAHCPGAELRLLQGQGHISVPDSAPTILAWLCDVVTAWPDGAPAVGATAEMSRIVSDTDISLFTEISGDRNPLHYDLEAAKATRFGEIVVQGGVTTAILNAVAAEKLPGPGTVFLNVNWDFKAPVRPGDTITGRVEITDVRADKPITKLRTSVTRDDGVVVVEGSAVCYTMPLPRER